MYYAYTCAFTFCACGRVCVCVFVAGMKFADMLVTHGNCNFNPLQRLYAEVNCHFDLLR